MIDKSNYLSRDQLTSILNSDKNLNCNEKSRLISIFTSTQVLADDEIRLELEA